MVARFTRISYRSHAALLDASGIIDPSPPTTDMFMFRFVIAAVFASLPLQGVAQAARVGRLPVLATPAVGARCAMMPTTRELRSSGIARLFSIDEPGHPRLLTFGVSAVDKPLMLMAMMSTRQQRRSEGESVSVFFGSDATVRSGRRSAYTTGIPARSSDDRALGLLPTDSIEAISLVRALLRLCGA